MNLFGYCYLVSTTRHDGNPERSRTKIGFTRDLMIENFIYKNYSRALTPLFVIDIIPTANAELSEKNIHYALNKYRIDPKHEIFDIDCEESQNVISDIKVYQYKIDVLSGLPFPPERNIDYNKWIDTKNSKNKAKIVNSQSSLPYFLDFLVEVTTNNKITSKSLSHLSKMYKQFLETKNISGFGINKKVLNSELEKYQVDRGGFIERGSDELYLYDIDKMRAWFIRNNIKHDKLKLKTASADFITTAKKTPLSMLLNYFTNKIDKLPQEVEIEITATNLLNEFLQFVIKDFPNAKAKVNSTNFGLEIKKYLIDKSGFIEKTYGRKGSIYSYNTNTAREWLTNKEHIIK